MIVGRQAELAELDGAVTRARSGQGGVVLVGGDPGTGKTRLVAEAADRAGATGVTVGWGVCPAVGAPPYLPWRRSLRATAPAAAALLGHSGGGGDAARFRLFAQIADVLGESPPTVLVLDDLQWADAASLQLLHFLMRGLRGVPVLLLGTYRSGEPAAPPGLLPVLDSLAGAGSALHLSGLDVEDVSRLAAQLGAADADARLLHDRTGGNPFLVEQLCRGGIAAGRRPVSALAVVGQHLGAVSPACRALLDVAAVAGRCRDVPRLAAALGRTPGSLLPLLDEAGRGGILTCTPPAAFAFRHDLMREAVLERLSGERTAGLHWHLGEMLATSPAEVDEAARHLQAGVLAGDRARAVEVSLRAAEQAAARLAFEQAADHLEWAVTSGGATGAELLVRLGEARLNAGDWERAAAAFERAVAEARATADAETLARAALGFGAGLSGFEVRLHDHRQITLLEEAAAALGEREGPLLAYVLARLSVALSFVDAPTRRAALSSRAVAVAEGSGDPAALAYALGTHADVVAGPDHVQERLVLAHRMVELARSAGSDELTLLGHRFRIVALLESGRIADVDREISAFTTVAERYRVPLVRWYVPLFGGMRALMRGDLETAERLAGEAAAVGAQAGSVNAPMLAETLRLAIAREAGTPPVLSDEMRDYLADALAAAPQVVGLYVLVGGLAMLAGDLVETARCLDAIAHLGFGADERDAEWLGSLTGAAEMCLALGDRVRAARVHELLAPYAGLFVVDGIAAACLCAVDEVLAGLAGLLGRPADARRHLEHARTAYVSAGMVPALRRVDAQLAEPAALAPVRQGTGALRRDGELWLLSYAGREVRLPDAKGLHDLAVLLGAPEREVHVAELTGAQVLQGGVDDVLDERARRAYRQRLRDLDEDLADADRDADPVRRGRARAERDALLQALAEATGLGGRSRTTGSDLERARQAVRSRLRHLLQRLEKVHPELARHLSASVRTGVTCCYAPEHPVRWDIASADVRRQLAPPG